MLSEKRIEELAFDLRNNGQDEDGIMLSEIERTLRQVAQEARRDAIQEAAALLDGMKAAAGAGYILMEAAVRVRQLSDS